MDPTPTQSSPPAPPAAAQQRNLLAAMAWMMGAVASFTLIAITGRQASRTLSTIDLMIYRSWLSLLFLVVVARLSGVTLGDLRTSRHGLHIVRAATHFVAQFSWLYALILIPLATLLSLEFTAPVWVALFAPLLVGERLTATRLLAAAVGFLGVLVVVRPHALTIGIGEVCAIIAALGFALSMVGTKRLTRTDSAFRILFYMMAYQSIMSAGFALRGLAWPDAATWPWVIAISVLGLTAHYSLARAFGCADAIVVAPMDFLRLPVAALIGVALYAEALDPMVLAGGAVVVMANLINLYGERRRAGR